MTSEKLAHRSDLLIKADGRKKKKEKKKRAMMDLVMEKALKDSSINLERERERDRLP